VITIPQERDFLIILPVVSFFGLLCYGCFMAQKTNSAFMKPMNVSSELAEVVGAGPMPRSEVVKKLWAYIKEHGLQDKENKRNINADEKLSKVFGGKKVVSMFEMTKLVSKHLS
jgi:upstream activation factor subunit UAF30